MPLVYGLVIHRRSCRRKYLGLPIGPCDKRTRCRQGKEPVEAGFPTAADKVIPTVVKIKNITKGKRVEGLTNNANGENPFRGNPLSKIFLR